jgi:hypothetical protein
MIMNVHLFVMEVVLIALIQNQLLFHEDHLHYYSNLNKYIFKILERKMNYRLRTRISRILRYITTIMDISRIVCYSFVELNNFSISNLTSCDS